MGWPRGVKKGARGTTLKEALAAADVDKEVMPIRTTVDIQPAPESRSQVRAKSKVSMRAGNNWDGLDASAEETPDRLRIPRDMFPEGMDLFWATRSIHGQEMKERLTKHYRKGWTPVHAEDFDGRFARMFPQDESGFIVMEAAILCARPLEISIKAKKRQESDAKEAIRLREQAFTKGGIGATGADHPSALATNRISRSMERIDIPKE